MALFDSVFAQMFEENQLFGGGEGNTLDSKNLVASTHIKREKASLPVDVRRRGGGTPHMKGVGMLVVSLRGVNFGFWSRLGCSGQKAIIFSREGLV